MSDIHTCSYYCTRPACVLAQRDELRDKFIDRYVGIPVREPVTPHLAGVWARAWEGQAGGQLAQQLTTNELAGLINEYAEIALRDINLQASDIFNHQPQPQKELKNED